MSTKTQEDAAQILPTTNYSQQLLQQWLPVKTLIWHHGAPLSQRDQGTPLIISDDIVNHAINSPYHAFFTGSLQALSKTERLRIALLQAKNEAINDAAKHGADISARQTVPAKLADQISITSLETLQKHLLEKIALHHHAWQNNIERWADGIIAILSNKITFIADEISELKTEERYYDIEARASELNIDFKPSKKRTFSDYYQLKTKIVLQSSLSRQQKPHTAEVLKASLAPCKEYFTQIDHDEVELNSIHKDELKQELGILDE